MQTTVKKTCTECGKDVSQIKRVKDAAGLYHCHECWAARSSSSNQQADGGSTRKEVGTASSTATTNLSSTPILPTTQRSVLTHPSAGITNPSTDLSNESPIGKPKDKHKRLRRIFGAGWVLLFLFVMILGLVQSGIDASGFAIGIAIFALGLACLWLDWWFCNRVTASGSRSLTVGKSVRAWVSLGSCLFGLMLGTIGLVFGGDLFVYIKEKNDLGAIPFIMLLLPIIALYLMPVIIVWTISNSVTVIARSKNNVLKAIIAVAALAAIVIGIAGYSRYRGVANLLGSKPSEISFVDFDSQFGAGLIGNPSLLSKTGEQAQESLKQYLGKMVSWKGVVLDVRDGQVLIQHRSLMGTNEVALVLGWWDAPSLRLLNKGDVVEYTGIISGVGDPYPYTLASGTIKNHHTASEDEQNQLLKDNDKAVLDQMYNKK